MPLKQRRHSGELERSLERQSWPQSRCVQGRAACVSACLWQQTAGRCSGERFSRKVESWPGGCETTGEEGPEEQAANFCIYLLMFLFVCFGLCLFVCFWVTRNGPFSQNSQGLQDRIQQIEQELPHTVSVSKSLSCYCELCPQMRHWTFCPSLFWPLKLWSK